VMCYLLGTTVAQTNFFMSRQDESEFLQMVFRRADTTVLAGSFFDTRHPVALQTGAKIGRQRSLTLVNAKLMPKPHCGDKGEGAYAGQYLFSLYRDPFMEMTRSASRGGLLVPGRLYCVEARGAGVSVAAAKLHGSWYRSLARWITSRYLNHNGWWIGPAAVDWSRRGGKLAFGDEVAHVLVHSLRDL
jgi:hypothetical protein